MRYLSATAAALFLACPVFAESVWIEGEQPSTHTFSRHSWYDSVSKDVFSGKEWLSHYRKDNPGEATYSLDVKGGDYTLWIRCNYFRTTMHHRLDKGTWAAVDLSSPRDTIMISPKPDHRFIGWVKAGKLKLSKGTHTVSFRISSTIANHGGIDCFCLTDEAFVPSGTMKPGESGGPATPDGWFPYVMDDDEFSPKSVIDMTHLIHEPAGTFGFLKRDGKELRFEKSPQPVKFWGVGANIDEKLSRKQQTQRIRYLVKHGVNMVRQHSVFGYLGPLKNGGLDRNKLDRFDRWFAELKKHGVYMTWSVFYPLVISKGDGYPPDLFAELEDGRTYGLVNISRRLQDLQIRYVRALLEHRNPYTGLVYRDDPALAVLEVHNEDCVFFHNPLNTLQAKKKPKHAAMLGRMFCDWAKETYGTDMKLRAAWGTKESLSAGALRIYGAWQMKGDKPDRRLGDFIRFLAEMQREFYERREQEIRAAGFKGVSVTTAWRAGGPAADAANLYCDTAMDMIDRHNYFGGGDGKHRIIPGNVK
ncbi:beta-galactosidase, partial [Planctomycetota bacterium]